MTLTLDLDQSLTARLRSEARRRGTTETAIVEELLRTKLPASMLLADIVEQWVAEDKTDDTAELERREKDLAALKQGLAAPAQK